MKYMTFNSSCSLAGLANLLEFKGINAEDFELALKMKLPYIFRYDENKREYKTGAMLQSADIYDEYLGTLGFRFYEEVCHKEAAAYELKNAFGEMMLGLNLDFGKHAVIFTMYENSKYHFINNVHKDSGELGRFTLSKKELMERLDDVVTLGSLWNCDTREADYTADMMRSLPTLRDYTAALRAFCNTRQTYTQIVYAMNRLFRPLMLDCAEMMKLTGNDVLAETLKALREQFMVIVESEQDAVIADILPMETVYAVIKRYTALINRQLCCA